MHLPAHTLPQHDGRWHPQPVEVRVAPLVRQPARREGAVEFAFALSVLCIIVVASVAFMRGTPVKPAEPKNAPVAAATH